MLSPEPTSTARCLDFSLAMFVDPHGQMLATVAESPDMFPVLQLIPVAAGAELGRTPRLAPGDGSSSGIASLYVTLN